jgi:hypothetical protein
MFGSLFQITTTRISLPNRTSHLSSLAIHLILPSTPFDSLHSLRLPTILTGTIFRTRAYLRSSCILLTALPKQHHPTQNSLHSLDSLHSLNSLQFSSPPSILTGTIFRTHAYLRNSSVLLTTLPNQHQPHPKHRPNQPITINIFTGTKNRTREAIGKKIFF